MVIAALLVQILQILVHQVIPGDRFAWNMQGPGLALVQSYRYEVEVDGHRLTDALKDVTCEVGPAPVAFVCSAPIPVSLGQHTLRVRWADATVPGLPAVEGPWSPALTYFMQPFPTAPSDLRTVRPTPSAPAQLRPVKPK